MTGARAVAAAQTVPVRGNVDANVEQHLRLAHLSAGERAGALVFPELSLTGYELDLARDLAFSTTDPRLAPLREAASGHALTLVVGAPVRLGSRLHIGAFILSPDGAVSLYTKHHLGVFSCDASADGIVPPAEETVFHPGDRNPLVDLGRGGCAAVAVCADTGRASHPRAAAARGARTYLASMFVIPSELEGEAAALGRHAGQHAMVVVMSNYGGPTGGLASAGSSAIWSDAGERLVQLESKGAGVAVAVEHEDGWHARGIMQRE